MLVYNEGFTAISHWLYRIFIFHPTEVPLFFPKCLWKLARFLPDIIQDLNVDAVLLDIHIFLKKYPSSYWKTKEDQRPMTTITVFLRTLVKLLGAEVSSLLFAIPVHVRRHVRSHVRVPTSLSTVQPHMPNRGFIVTTETLVTVTFCLYNSVLSCFILIETLDMLQRQETLYFRYMDLGIARATPND